MRIRKNEKGKSKNKKFLTERMNDRVRNSKKQIKREDLKKKRNIKCEKDSSKRFREDCQMPVFKQRRI